MELLPCPFCGSADVEMVTRYELFVVECQDCGAVGQDRANEHYAAAAWNRRAPDPALLALAKLGGALFHRSWQEGVGFCDTEWLQDELDGDAVRYGLADKGPNARLDMAPGIADAIAALLAPDQHEGATDGD